MAPYLYTPLNRKKKQIRLLTLFPVAASVEIRIHINTVALTEENRPRYEALSYTWGSSEDSLQVKVEPSRNDILAVTQKLASALVHLRHDHESRVLWIDAICIDQKNTKERSEQVGRMRDIYAMADRIVVWLGPGTDNSKLALTTLHDLNLEVEVDWSHLAMKAAPNRDPSWADLSYPLPYDAETLQAISDLLNRSWFSRLWIWQEIHFAKSNAIILCGQEVQRWDHFRSALFCIERKPLRYHGDALDFSRLERGIIMASNLVEHQVFGRPGSLSILSSRTKHSKCSDPKDRIYALSGITRSKVTDTQIDYAKSINQVYQEATLDDINYSKDLNILSLCNIRARRPDQPTWVPNFAVAGLASPITTCRANGYPGSESQLIDERILEVTGKHMATVTLVETLMLEDFSIEELLKSIQRLIPQRHIEEVAYIGGGSLLDVYCRTLRWDEFTETNLHETDYASFEKIKEALRYALLSKPSNNPYLFRQNTEYISGRRLFTTEEGYIGLAPEGAESGDQVCVLLRCDAPILLRSIGNGQYHVVGESYVQGLMRTEGFLGRLPNPWQSIWRLDGKGGARLAFNHLRTEEITKNDPRLGPPPSGWRTMSHDQELYYDFWVNVDTGERTWSDPRMSAEALKGRGVNLRTFALV
ncbi:MAG: hypothetical protein Q9187_005601 [Circinaria calcarea]